MNRLKYSLTSTLSIFFPIIMIILSNIMKVQSLRHFHSSLHSSTKVQSHVQSIHRKPPYLSYHKVSMSSKPDLSSEMNSKYFEFKRLENTLYSWWDKSGFFEPKDFHNKNSDSSSSSNSKKKPFVIPMPPPNVTGYLHMGHAMFVALQDLMARFQRMRGRPTLWLPGTDHAGIATQLLVERALAKEGISRHSLGREKFLEKVWEWKEEKGGYITGQMKRLGASADWSRERFTLEEKMSNSVTEAFVLLHERGLIYQGEYMVNWSPNLQTAVSDLEVEYTEESGKLYYFKYMLEDGSDFIPVATTRPETILGDAAVCVNPNDERIPVIADEYVDKEFGTGALKITPAHDVNDYEIAKRYNLPLINIMNKDASINAVGGSKYQGLDRFECREKLWKDLEGMGQTIKVESHTQRVPRSQRGGEVIEPMVSKQWFAKMENMAARAVQAAKNKEIVFVPDRYEKIWYGWLENIHDWCISRQLWWGHRIPVYYVYKNGNPISDKAYIVARSYKEAMIQAKTIYGDEITLIQDEDVLDTWFSSGLWPFATIGWPQDADKNGKAIDITSDLAKFYPASVMETGYDILFFWVARMVMMGFEFTGQSPFHTIYLHGLVRDAQGQKMSKTKGNVIDPIDTIDQYGCDALRFALVTGSTPGQDIPLSMEKIESNRNFVTKLWNIGKFIQNTLSTLSEEEKSHLAVRSTDTSYSMTKDRILSLPLAERFIISKVHELANDVTLAIEEYDFNRATARLYEFIWDELADWYVEASKTRMRNPNQAYLARQTLVYVWDTTLRLLHPFMPFVTETLWQLIPHEGESLMISSWPQIQLIDSKNDQDGKERELAMPILSEDIKVFQSLQSLVRAVRNVRAEYKVEGGKAITAIIKVSNTKLLSLLQSERLVISLLGRIDDRSLDIDLTSNPSAVVPYSSLIGDRGHVHLIIEEGLEVFLPLAALVDVEKEMQRLRKQEEKLRKDVMTLESRLSSPGFMDKAPAQMVTEVKANLQDKKDQLLLIEKSLASFQS